MQGSHCLNCGDLLLGNYCTNCGQKSATHRITIQHFIMHDLLHGVWHLEKGTLFTLKEAIVRPGQAALDYISGKRARYYNVFYLSLLLVGLNIVLIYIFGGLNADADYNKASLTVVDFLSRNVKFIALGFVPILALNSMLFFRRLKLNFAENLILGGMCLVGILILNTLFYLANILTERTDVLFFGILEVVFFFGMLLFPIWTYWNATKMRYTIMGRVWRVAAFFILLLVQALSLLILITYLLTNQTQLEVFL